MTKYLFYGSLFTIILSSLFFSTKDQLFTPNAMNNAFLETKSTFGIQKTLTGSTKKVWQAEQATLLGFDVSGSVVPLCALDNYLVLHENGEYTELEGPNKCEKDDPDLYGKGHWSLEGNVLTLDIEEGVFEWEIIRITEDEIEVKMVGILPLKLYLKSRDVPVI